MRLLNLIFIGMMLGLIGQASANNLKISDISQPTGKSLRFTVNWDNSWYLDAIAEPNNHDGIYIFAKYRIKGSNTWQELPLMNAKTGIYKLDWYSVDGNRFIISKPNNPITDSETVINCSIQLKETGTQLMDIKVYAIEMVYIPRGSFYVGDAAANGSLKRGNDSKPYFIQTEEQILVGKSTGSLLDTGADAPTQTIPSEYPKGFAGNYIMKYELNQQQYTDFLNSLSYQQQTNHTTAKPTGAKGTPALSVGNTCRNGIVIDKPSNGTDPARYAIDGNGNGQYNEDNDGQGRACNWLNWNDLSAYLAWSGMQAMTELQFEKICRGPNDPIAWEFAWGNANVVDANTIIDNGTDKERATDALANDFGLASHGYDGPQGVIRTGFAATNRTGRIETGAAYYGVMEMSGNAWETVINIHTSAGVKYKGEIANLTLGINGEALSNTWPSSSTALGTGVKGGAWNSGILPKFKDLSISDRFYINLAVSQRRNTVGGRGVINIK